MNTSISKKTQRLCVSAMMIALATVLSLASKLIPALEMPFGGSITLCSMVPIVYISYRYNVKWGLFSGFVYSVLQILTGMSALKGLSAWSLVASLFLDYFIAFTVLGLGGMFRKTITNRALGFTLGVAIAGVLRYICHVISGFLLWATADNIAWFLGEGALATDVPFRWVQLLYSVIYNGTYMIPDIITATIGAAIISLTAKRLLVPEDLKQA